MCKIRCSMWCQLKWVYLCACVFTRVRQEYGAFTKFPGEFSAPVPGDIDACIEVCSPNCWFAFYELIMILFVKIMDKEGSKPRKP
jgi:hypothetical protein